MYHFEMWEYDRSLTHTLGLQDATFRHCFFLVLLEKDFFFFEINLGPIVKN